MLHVLAEYGWGQVLAGIGQPVSQFRGFVPSTGWQAILKPWNLGVTTQLVVQGSTLPIITNFRPFTVGSLFKRSKPCKDALDLMFEQTSKKINSKQIINQEVTFIIFHDFLKLPKPTSIHPSIHPSIFLPIAQSMIVDLEQNLRRALDRRKPRSFVVPPNGPKCVTCGRETSFRAWWLGVSNPVKTHLKCMKNPL